MSHLQTIPPSSNSLSLAEVLERVLDKGLVIAGDIKVKLCDIELLTIQIRLLVASVEKAREMGLTWWWQTPAQQAQPEIPAKPSQGLPLSDAGGQHAYQPLRSQAYAEPTV